jgi:peptidoglycan biosynthesis protein MviN/MurJ (putative lipid II flippase)
MLKVMTAWERYLHMQFWWMHLMTLIWLIFTILLFIIEPLFLHRLFHEKATTNGNKAFNLLHIMHIFLLMLSLLAVFGAVAGSHGFQFF